MDSWDAPVSQSGGGDVSFQNENAQLKAADDGWGKPITTFPSDLTWDSEPIPKQWGDTPDSSLKNENFKNPNSEAARITEGYSKRGKGEDGYSNNRQRTENFRQDNGRPFRGFRGPRGGGPRGGGPRVKSDGCYNCGQMGHWARDCPNQNPRNNRRSLSNRQSNNDDQYSNRGYSNEPPISRDDDWPSAGNLDGEQDDSRKNPKPGLYDSIHAPKPDSAPYVNSNRVLSGGDAPPKPREEELEKKMEKMRSENEKILERRKIVEQDEAQFKKAEEERKQQELRDLEVQRKRLEEEEEEKKRRDEQQRRLQARIDSEREANRRTNNRETREWDKEKQENDWNYDRTNRGSGNPRSRGRGDFRDERNEYSRNNRGRGNDFRGNSRGGRRGSQTQNRGNSSSGRGRRNSSRFTTQEEFGGGESWAEQQEAEQNGIKAQLPWEKEDQEASNEFASSNDGRTPSKPNNDEWTHQTPPSKQNNDDWIKDSKETPKWSQELETQGKVQDTKVDPVSKDSWDAPVRPQIGDSDDWKKGATWN